MINIKGLCYSATIVGCKESNWRSKRDKDPYKAQYEKIKERKSGDEPVFRDILRHVHYGKEKNDESM